MAMAALPYIPLPQPQPLPLPRLLRSSSPFQQFPTEAISLGQQKTRQAHGGSIGPGFPVPEGKAD